MLSDQGAAADGGTGSGPTYYRNEAEVLLGQLCTEQELRLLFAWSDGLVPQARVAPLLTRLRSTPGLAAGLLMR